MYGKTIALRAPQRLLNEVDRLSHSEAKTRTDVILAGLRRYCRDAQQRAVDRGAAASLDDGADRAAWEE